MDKRTKDTIIGLGAGLLLTALVITGDQVTRHIDAKAEPTQTVTTSTRAGVSDALDVVVDTSSAITTPEAIKPATPSAVTTPQAIKPKKKKKTDAQRVAELYTKEELDLIYKCVQCEAGVYDKRWSKYSAKEYEMSQRLITDVILNMVADKKYPNTVTKVISNHGRFSVYPNAIKRCKVTKQIKKVVNNELLKHGNKKVMYFRSQHYHGFGTPYKHYAGSWFSTK